MSVNRFTTHPDELISASLTGELTPLERRELDSHLAACAQCRDTLEAFRAQRDLLSRMAQPPMPRDMGARVHAGIERGRGEARWWQRPRTILAGVASLGTVAAALLLTVVLLNRNSPVAVGSQGPTASETGSAVASASTNPTPSASATQPPLNIQPGDLVYASVQGPFDKLQLQIVRQESGKAVSPSKPSTISWDAVKAASLSPDGGAYAFAMDVGAKGTWQIFVTDLQDQTTTQLAETLPQSFGRRLLWSPDGRYLAFSVMPDQSNASDVWMYDRQAHASQPITKMGDTYAASWAPISGTTETLWISEGSETPSSFALHFGMDAGVPPPSVLSLKPADKAAGVFLPLISPDGKSAIFWRGSMTLDSIAGWIFSRGGLPQLTGSSVSGVPAWDSGAPLFGDLAEDPSGQDFASGQVTWSADSDAYAFWDGQWTGGQQGANYPDQQAVYAGRVSSGPLTKASQLDLGKMTSASGDSLMVVDVALSPDGRTAAVTLLVPRAGDLSPPSAFLRTTPTSGGPAKDVIPTASPPWLGPGTYVPDTVGP